MDGASSILVARFSFYPYAKTRSAGALNLSADVLFERYTNAQYAVKQPALKAARSKPDVS